MSYTIRRKVEWWREEGEAKLLEQQERKRLQTEMELRKKLTEKYELKKGSDGKNTEPIIRKKAKQLKKSDESAILARKRRIAELESQIDDEEKMSLEDMEISVDKNDELPEVQEVEVDEVHGGYCTCPKCGAKLAIELVDEEEEEEEEEDYETEEEQEEENEDTVEAENRDISAKQLEAYRRRKARLRAKRMGEDTSEFGVEYGSDTDNMVISGLPRNGKKMKDGEPGDEEDFGIDPQDTDVMVGKGRPMDGDKILTTDSGSRMPERARFAKKRKYRVAEEEYVNPQEDEFEDEDTLADLLDDDDDDYANIPIEVGGNPDAVSRVKAVEERRRVRNRVNESFKWKDFLNGKY